MSMLHPLLQPYQPSEADPFDRVKAAHLLNRAGFGGTEEEVEKVVRLGPAKAVESLLDFPNASADEQNDKEVPDLSAIHGVAANFKQIRRELVGKTKEQRQQVIKKLQMQNREAFEAAWAWWIRRMAFGPHPLQEKLALFWHGHFTTSFREERSALLIWEQNELLRKMAAGNFRQFVHAVSRDPAMLDYLNNAQNRKGHPNENYARELMELFTLGIGNYSEDDIKEAARAFTGWMHDGDRFVFNQRQHDDGVKRFLGKSGKFNGDEIIELILAHPACAGFITSELWAYFVQPEPEPELVNALGALLREAKFELRPLLRTMLTSKAFYGPRAVGVQIKGPVQLVVGTIRMLRIQMPPALSLRGPLYLMGQVPMMPPNVKGWPGGHAWINASTLFARYNTAVRLANAVTGALLLGEIPQRSEALVDALVTRLIQRPIEDSQRRVLVEAAEGKSAGGDAALKHIAQLIVSMPEYQLC